MSLFSFLKKKQENELDIPPPPPIEEVKSGEIGLVPKDNIPLPPKKNISPTLFKDKNIMNEPEDQMEFPEFPEIPEPEQEIKTPEYRFEPIEEESEVVHPIAHQMPERIKTPERINIPKTNIREPDRIFKQNTELERVSEERHFLREPIFVKTDQYQNMIDSINKINNKMKECDFIAEELNEIKNKKDKEFNRWRINLEDMQRKVSLVEKSLFEVAK